MNAVRIHWSEHQHQHGFQNANIMIHWDSKSQRKLFFSNSNIVKCHTELFQVIEIGMAILKTIKHCCFTEIVFTSTDNIFGSKGIVIRAFCGKDKILQGVQFSMRWSYRRSEKSKTTVNKFWEMTWKCYNLTFSDWLCFLWIHILWILCWEWDMH